MTNVADAGPVAASSDGLAPGIGGKPLGRVSQIRPHSVSVWPASAAVLGAVEAAELAAVDGAGGAAEALPEGPPDPQAASTSVAMGPRPERNDSCGQS